MHLKNFACLCVHLRACICICVCLHLCVSAFVCVCICVCLHLRVSAFACVCICVCLLLHTCICVCVRLHACVCAQKISDLDASRHKRISASRHIFCSRTFGTYYVYMIICLTIALSPTLMGVITKLAVGDLASWCDHWYCSVSRWLEGHCSNDPR